MPNGKRVYTHKKDRMIPVEHGSILDELDHAMSPHAGPYKTKRNKKGIL